MRLRKALIVTAWVLGALAIGLLLLGIWATAYTNNAQSIKQDTETRQVYSCCEPDVDYESIDAMLDRITEPVPFIEISDDDRYIVECVVAGEAGGHSYELMKAVAQCMAISMDMRKMSADEVRQEHQYHGYNPELEQTDPSAWAMVCSAVSEIFDDGNFVVYEPIEYFYNPSYGGGNFHEKMDFIIEIDGVRFFRDVEVG